MGCAADGGLRFLRVYDRLRKSPLDGRTDFRVQRPDEAIRPPRRPSLTVGNDGEVPAPPPSPIGGWCTEQRLLEKGYRFNGKQKTLALGIYPDVPLEKAKVRHQAARYLLASGTDPSLRRRELRTAKVADIGATVDMAHHPRRDRSRRDVSTQTEVELSREARVSRAG